MRSERQDEANAPEELDAFGVSVVLGVLKELDALETLGAAEVFPDITA
jgi:hypothetical protein